MTRQYRTAFGSVARNTYATGQQPLVMRAAEQRRATRAAELWEGLILDAAVFRAVSPLRALVTRRGDPLELGAREWRVHRHKLSDELVLRFYDEQRLRGVQVVSRLRVIATEAVEAAHTLAERIVPTQRGAET